LAVDSEGVQTAAEASNVRSSITEISWKRLEDLGTSEARGHSRGSCVVKDDGP
jgi:hypothetical protein